ncbi:MAG: D-alanyl-D-alanine carboxypeptidase family protein [Actinomycetota bacterium]|nr:D-alanyl-D-alanine carboxypeptidase family protein [Actinomycetota bacterium]
MPAFQPRKVAAPVAALLLALVPMSSIPAQAARQSDPRQRREQVKKQRAEVAARLNVLRASDAQLERALDALGANVRVQQRAAADARQRAEVAASSAVAARERERQTGERLASLRQSMRDSAIRAYTRGTLTDVVVGLDGGSFAELARKQEMVRFTARRRGDVADELRATRQDLVAERQQAEGAEQQAQARREQADARLGEVEDARDHQQRVADAVEQRVERALAEADSLAALDKQLAADIARRQAALARRIGPRPGPSGGTRRLGSVSVTTVRGIVVNTQLASRLEALLAAAEADGVPLSGAGYRNSAGQVAARRANCGSSDSDIYDKPASQCRPPTARPGQSMHEQGLAIDFTYNGQIIRRGSARFQWLARNAGRFGLRNLPAEPWHWSTNGN